MKDLNNMKLLQKFTLICFQLCTQLCLMAFIYAPVTAAQNSNRDTEPGYSTDIPSLRRLIGPELENAFSGLTLDGIYKLPRERSGTRSFTESFYADGTSYYREGKFTQEGFWIIKNNRTVCFTYPTEGPHENCFAIFESGTCHYAYAPRNVRNGKPISPNSWTAKTLKRGDVSTCDNLVS